MVKFGRHLQNEIIPEWKEAFVDYGHLKKLIKDINYFIVPTNPQLRKNNLFFFGKPPEQHKAIQVRKKLDFSDSKVDSYETRLFEQFGEITGGKEFFACLDLQLNKVNVFFQAKEKEFIERGECLMKQVSILFELIDQNCKKDLSEDISISRELSCGETSSGRGKSDQEVGNNSQTNTENSNEMKIFMKINSEEEKMGTLPSHNFNCQEKSIRIKIPMTNPTRLFLWDDLADKFPKTCGSEINCRHINKMKLIHAEKMIKGVLVELYKGLGYLKTYRYLNMLAFIKILKKFDKVTNTKITPIYLKAVEYSYFSSSDKINKLADEVEEIFVKHFTEDNRKKAMKYLKPTHRKESHSVTFFTGLFTGCFLAFFASCIITAPITGLYKRIHDKFYIETVYPVLSIFSLVFLHLFMYGCNIFTWRKARINYGLILELAQTKQLKYTDVFLVCATSMTCVMGVLCLQLFLVTNEYSYPQVQAIPGLLSLVFVVLFVCPVNICYKSTRYRFLRVMRNIIFSPLYKVDMLDFFMADQLCSQVAMLRNLEYVACYYLTGSFKTLDNNYCSKAKSYRDLSYVVSFLPYYWRVMQCGRRYFEEDRRSHLYNMGKYISAMLAAGAKIAYEKERTRIWYFILVITSSMATIYQLYWDYVKDWGLFQRRSKNLWLRDELMLRRKSIYFLSMGLNFILRFAWIGSVLHYEGIDYRVLGLILAALEIIRRGQWNFYRLENEQVTNAGKFRAVKTVPLPFHEVDEQDC